MAVRNANLGNRDSELRRNSRSGNRDDLKRDAPLLRISFQQTDKDRYGQKHEKDADKAHGCITLVRSDAAEHHPVDAPAEAQAGVQHPLQEVMVVVPDAFCDDPGTYLLTVIRSRMNWRRRWLKLTKKDVADFEVAIVGPAEVSRKAARGSPLGRAEK